MNTLEIKKLLESKPFQPFQIVLVDGTKYLIPAGDFLHVFKTGIVAYDGEDGTHWLNVNLITRVEFPIAA